MQTCLAVRGGISDPLARPARRVGAVACRAGRFGGAGGGTPSREELMDAVDSKQQIDIERLISNCLQLTDRVEEVEAQLLQLEERGKDRAVALRALLRDSKAMDKFLDQHEDGQLELPSDERAEPWESYRNSFTLALSKGYIRTVDALRNRLMATEWELGLRPIALQVGVSRFESFCASNNQRDVDYDTLSEIYRDPSDLSAIQDPVLRMQARAIIVQAEAEERVKAWTACTIEAQRLSTQFSEAEFISQLLPDPLEHGVVDSLRKLVTPLMSSMGRA